jgi:tripartite-type tricarboxylate transporter receptor subunit TctC
MGTGRGFVMPAGVPKDQLTTMEGAFKRVYDSAAYKEFAIRNNFEDMYLNSTAFAKYLAELSKEMAAFLAYISAPAK